MPIRCNAVPLETNPVESACWCVAEAPASPDASASSYRCPENVFRLPIVVAEHKFVQIERQILLAHLVIAAHDSALEQRPKAFNRVRVDDAVDVFARTVTDDAMWQGVRA